MRTSRRAAATLLWCAAIAVCSGGLRAAPQEPAGGTSPALTRIKQRLNKPPAPTLTTKAAVPLRAVFRTRVTERPWVPTLEEHLRETFELTDFQRRYAEYASRCCGLDLGALFGSVEQALDERRQRKVREHVTRELAEVEAARAPVGKR